MKIKTLNHLSEWYHFLEASQRVMFYGAGYYLKMAVDDLRTKGIAWREKVSCVIVSSRLGNPDEKYGLPVVEHKSVQYEAGDCIVLTLGEPFWDEVTRLYEQMDVQVIRLDFNMFQEDEYEEIYRELEPFLTEFQRNQSGETVRTMPQEKRAWTMWWQGVDAAPAIIRACLASQKKYMPKDVEYVVLTKGNIKEYVEIPDDLLKKVDAGSISLNHLSDFIRSRLLYLRGGLWMDASIYLLEPLDERMFQYPFYSRNLPGSQFGCDAMWSGFCVCAWPHGKLYQFVSEAFEWYFKNSKGLQHYLAIDYFTAIACNLFSDVKKEMQDVPYNNRGVLLLATHLTEPYHAALYESMVKDCTYQKLTWKTDWTNKEKKGTFYEKILEAEGIHDPQSKL